MRKIFLPMAYKLGIGHTQNCTQGFMKNFGNGGVKEWGAAIEASRNFFEHPFLQGSVVYKYD